jgi:hypothetical protein
MIFETQRLELNPEQLCPHTGELVSLEDIYPNYCDPLFPEDPLFRSEPALYFVLQQNIYCPKWWYSPFSKASSKLANYKILYIGKALSMNDRWRNHHRLPQFLMHGCAKNLDSVRVSCFYFPEFEKLSKECINDLLLQMERECIEHFKPILNRTPVYDGNLSNQEIIDLYSIPLIEEYSA